MRAFAIAAALGAAGCVTPAASARPVEIPVDGLPAGAVVGAWRVHVSEPGDPEERRLAGSGGPILAFAVSRRGAQLRALEAQAIRAQAFARAGAPPLLAIWSKTGVSSHVRCEYAPRDSAYCLERCEDYEPTNADELAPTGRVWVSPSCDGSEPLAP